MKRRRAKETWEKLPVELRQTLTEVAKVVEESADAFMASRARETVAQPPVPVLPPQPTPVPVPTAPVLASGARDRASRRAARSNRLLSW